MSSILTVSQINRYLAHKLSSDAKLKGLAIKGEISNWNVNHRSGHAYFSVKDENSSLRCVMFRSAAEKLRFVPENGMAVIAFGSLEVYERDGTCQLITQELHPFGAGAVSLGLEQLKRRLAEMGVFDREGKRPVPPVPSKLAVVTSATGAALQDILNILQRRYPVVEVEIYPALVQGEQAPESISTAVKKADTCGADTIILARGGGSQEDLMAFNTEKVVMSVFNCVTPVISAVGHETDTTLTDLAADLRAPTPSAAAELAVPDRSNLLSAVSLVEKRLLRAFSANTEKYTSRLTELALRLEKLSPEQQLTREQDKLAALSKRLEAAEASRLERSSLSLDKYASQLFALGPFNILGRGYSITQHNGKAVRTSKELRPGDTVRLTFASGTAEAEITKVNENDL